MLARVRDDLLDFGGCDVPWKDTAYPNALSAYFEHDPRGLFAVHGKEFLYHGHHEIHRGEIVVKEHDLEEGRRFDSRDLRFQNGFFLFFDDHAAHSKQPQ